MREAWLVSLFVSVAEDADHRAVGPDDFVNSGDRQATKAVLCGLFEVETARNPALKGNVAVIPKPFAAHI